MKEKFWGLRKDEVDRFIRRMEREFQFEIQKLEFELISTKKENESLQEQIKMEEKKQISLSIKDPYWQLANSRIKTVIKLLQHQKESELELLREASNEKIAKFQFEINQLDDEIQSINQTISRFLFQLDSKPHENSDQPQIQMEAKYQVEKELEDLHDENSLSIRELEEEVVSINHEPIETLKEQIWMKQADPIQIGEIYEKEPEHIKEEIFSEKDHILEQISSFKDQYIIGKVTGADLFDLSGKLIIAVNTKITKEVVELANKHGKLAELIVNMKILGADDETN